jgi:hypothetical protein
MTKDKNSDILELLNQFREMMNKKPPLDKMYDEVRMMRFKIKPLQGDISILNLKDSQLIETLWNLGKLDDFFHKRYRQVPARKKNLFFKVFQDLNHKFQQELNRLNLRQEKVINNPSLIEMEIIKENDLDKKPN